MPGNDSDVGSCVYRSKHIHLLGEGGVGGITSLSILFIFTRCQNQMVWKYDAFDNMFDLDINVICIE